MEIKNIYKSFGDNKVLENISMRFDEGITCIMGPSGRGKTTLAYIIARLVAPDSGEISFPGGQKKISLMFQEDRLLEWENAISNVLFVTKSPILGGVRKKREYLERGKELLTQAGLADSMYKKAAELSGGMKRRVCLCRALIADYDLLILDEPFKGLDSGIKPSIMDMVKSHAAGKTVICITHDPAEAEFLGGELVAVNRLE
ncbi:MAG: ATP-binding cassette domain-containing protein [Defluviitaleaceae bacterium]|nr:ATP-binding cassette domain-containing protein [Defluviitaleaceae bacterium]